jgi:hypothetical protein
VGGGWRAVGVENAIKINYYLLFSTTSKEVSIGAPQEVLGICR